MKRLISVIRYLSEIIDDSCAMSIYNAYIFPHIKYGIELYGTAKPIHLNKVQVLQNKLLKILFKRNKRDSPRELLKEKGILNCRNLNKYFLLLFIYKQQNNLLPVVFRNYFTHTSETHNYETRQRNNIHISYCRTDIGQTSTCYFGAKLWNSLPVKIKESTSLSIFKTKCKNYLLPAQ